jgi:hypothetical protein
MKRTLLIITVAAVATFASAGSLLAQDAVQTTTSTTTNAGTISEFSPQTIVVRTEGAAEPVRYNYTKTTTYVDDSGNPVSMETVRSGLPVTVYYTHEGDQLVATKVVVRKTTEVAAPAPQAVQETHQTTTTTTTDK